MSIPIALFMDPCTKRSTKTVHIQYLALGLDPMRILAEGGLSLTLTDWIRTELLQKQKPLKLFLAAEIGIAIPWKW